MDPGWKKSGSERLENGKNPERLEDGKNPDPRD
jgi:hypothetical protein